MKNTLLLIFCFFLSITYGQSAKTYYNQAKNKFENKNYKQALKLLDLSLELKPKYKKALKLRGDIKYELNDFQGALTDYKNLLKRNTVNAKSNILVGKTFVKLKEPDSAIHYLNKSIQLSPILAEANMFLGDAFFSIGECDKANYNYKVALKKYSKLPGIQLRRARLFSEEGKVCMALKYYKEAVELEPNNLDIIEERAHYILSIMGAKSAKKEYFRILKKDSTRFEVVLGLGICDVFVHNFEEAIISFNKAVQLKKSSHRAYYQRAFCNYVLNKNKDIVLKDLKTSLLINPNYKPAVELLNHIENNVDFLYIIDLYDRVHNFHVLNNLADGDFKDFDFVNGCNSSWTTRTTGTTVVNSWTTWEEE